MPQPNTPKGFPRPAATDRLTDAYDHISDLADAVDAYLDGAWVTAGFVAAAGFTNTASRYRKILGGIVLVELVCTRTGVALGSPATGNMSNTSMITVPAAARPSVDTAFAWVSGETNGGGILQSSGNASLVSMNSTSAVEVGTIVRASFVVSP